MPTMDSWATREKDLVSLRETQRGQIYFFHLVLGTRSATPAVENQFSGQAFNVKNECL